MTWERGVRQRILVGTVPQQLHVDGMGLKDSRSRAVLVQRLGAREIALDPFKLLLHRGSEGGVMGR